MQACCCASPGCCLTCNLQVNYFIEHLEEKDTLEPKGYEGQAAPAEAAAAAEKAKAKKAAAAAAAAAKRAAAAAPLPKPAGRVIVVGAGPAGLAAATVLKVGSTRF
jgi:heterodisulfide reductase subunit A-like polyferredoxin